ncbi:MAG: cation diffusion facilitator family transporter [Candidatus Riflebacteria bacterium]|nr:cation diffusion facilitator family transporter [Candidatus Riflebacteria bacterium]
MTETKHSHSECSHEHEHEHEHTHIHTRSAGLHSHNHGHGHSHGPANYNKIFAMGVSLNIIYVIIEGGYGFLTSSLSLLADAGHNLSDILGLLLAWGAHYLAQKNTSKRRTYGLKSSSILAALFNSLILMLAVGGIIIEAIKRFSSPVALEGNTIIFVATVGIIINAFTALLFMKDQKKDLNIRGAYLHMLADAAVSAGVVFSGFIIKYTAISIIDPIVSIIVAIVIFMGTWNLLKESLNLALHAVPEGIDPDEVNHFLKSLSGVEATHDLHIWGMSTTEIALTVHLVKPSVEDDDEVIKAANEGLKRLGISHSTIQLERTCENCPTENMCENGLCSQ